MLIPPDLQAPNKGGCVMERKEYCSDCMGHVDIDQQGERMCGVCNPTYAYCTEDSDDEIQELNFDD